MTNFLRRSFDTPTRRSVQRPRPRGKAPARSRWALAALVLLATGAASAQVSVPFSATVPFTSTAQVASYVVQLATLPLRPELLITALPDEAHPNIQLQIEITDFNVSSSGGFGHCPEVGDVLRSTPATGSTQLVWKVWSCDPEEGGLVGETARVDVRVLDFGSTPAPANVTLAMRGVTGVATNSQLMPYWAPGVQHTLTLNATKDTVLYQRSPTTSNGTGDFLWTGRDVTGGSPAQRFNVRSLVSFPIRQGRIPQNATIVSATLQVDVESILGTANTLVVWEAPFDGPWDEGIANGAGNEFLGATSLTSAASWNLRRQIPDNCWNGSCPGDGAQSFTQLASQVVTTTGVKNLTSTALRDFVASATSSGGNSVFFPDGLVLTGLETATATNGLQLASRENADVGASPPRLVVTFTVPAAPQESDPALGVVSFFDEGQNLRWIYDLDGDGVYQTPVVGGICTIVTPDTNRSLPYSYQYGGTPFTGHDCCTWRIESQAPGSGVVGVGQLIFFHNLDAANPANLPPDTDRDGIRDLCDNCRLQPNGPILGSCLSGPSVGRPCRSNLECPSGSCSLSQEDGDGNGVGNACVPEPAIASLLTAGVLAIAARARARRPGQAWTN